MTQSGHRPCIPPFQIVIPACYDLHAGHGAKMNRRILGALRNVAVAMVCTVAVSFLMASFACSAVQSAESKRVLMIHSFGRDFKPWKEYGLTIRTELDRQSPWPLDIQDQSLVSARDSYEGPEVPFIEYLRALYSKNPPDLIVALGAPAAIFVQRYRPRIFPKAPMVFTAVEQRRIDVSALTELDTVVAVRHDFPAIIENILQILPDTKERHGGNRKLSE